MWGGLRTVIYALSLVVFIVLLPEGIFHYIQRKYQAFRAVVEVEGEARRIICEAPYYERSYQ